MRQQFSNLYRFVTCAVPGLALIGVLHSCGGGGSKTSGPPAGATCETLNLLSCGQDGAGQPALLVCQEDEQADPSRAWSVRQVCACRCDPSVLTCVDDCATTDGGDIGQPDGQSRADERSATDESVLETAGDVSDIVDTSSGPACDSHRQCGAPQYVCVEGHCRPGCSADSDCESGWRCSIDTGVCIQRCLIQEDCTQQGFHCDAGRCVPGCTFIGCDEGQQCDPESGLCSPGFCQWEVQFHSQFLYFGQQPQAGQGLALNLQVFQFVPLPVTLDSVVLTPDSDAEFELQDAPAPGTQANPGDMFSILVVVNPTDTTGTFGKVVVNTSAATCGLGETILLGEGDHPCLVADVAELDLGPVAFGSYDRGTVRITNNCAAPITPVWTGQISTDSDWVLEPIAPNTPILPGAVLELHLTLVPRTIGVRNSRFFLVSNSKENRVVPILLKGVGVE